MPSPRFQLPPRRILEGAPPPKSLKLRYAIYNYYGRGPIARLKRKRFNRALQLAPRDRNLSVVDMGCGDGVLLPTLAHHFSRVAGVDPSRDMMSTAEHVVRTMGLGNVRLLLNRDMEWADLRDSLGEGYGLMLLLETLEHVGSQPDLWASKMEFLRQCFTLLEPGSPIVISVPRMVGPFILLKNGIQSLLGRPRDALTFPQLLRSAVLKETTDLEPLWDGRHVGFNHLRLEEHLAQHFVVERRTASITSIFYRIHTMPPSSATAP